MGFSSHYLAMHVSLKFPLWTLSHVSVPDGVDDAKIRARLLNEFDIEVGGGLGAQKMKNPPRRINGIGQQ